MLTKNDQEKAENLLTELLLAALRAPEQIKGSIADLAIGVADALTEEQVERAKEYAMYRYRYHNQSQ